MTRSVLVTGGNRGIGRAIATTIAARGDRVAVTHRSGEPPDGVLGVRCDVTDVDEVDRAFTTVEEAQGPVEVLVANAGITRDTLLMRMPDDAWHDVLDTNLSGSFRVVRRAARGMMRTRWGRVVLVSSVVGMLGSAGQVNYAASKAGLVGLARSVARELGSRGVTANIVAPGFVETDMTVDLPEATKEQYRGQVPLQRFATANEVAAVVAFLTSEEAGYVTGALVPVDGGLGMGH